jgi:hypothetical protein
MNTKKFLWASLAGTLVMFLLGGLWHALLLKDFYAAQFGATARSEPAVFFSFLGYLSLAILMSLVFPAANKGGSALKEGSRFGTLMGLLSHLPFSLVFYANTTTYTLSHVLLDGAWHIVEQGMGGIVIALIYSRKD